MVLPSSFEEYTGEVWDPTDHENEIKEANQVLYEFITDMGANRVPTATLDILQSASETLGLYAGYPEDTCLIIDFLHITGGKSYRDTAAILKEYLEQMNSLIEARRAKSVKLAVEPATNPCSESQADDDIPF